MAHAASLPSAPSFSLRARTAEIAQTSGGFRATGLSYAPNGGAVIQGDSKASGAIYNPDTQIAYLNYADAARAEYLEMTTTAAAAGGSPAGAMHYTMRMGGANATVGMGGGDVQMSQPGLMALTGAAAMAEASVDVSSNDGRFGVRVQGRALSNQRLFLPAANFAETHLILSAKPMLTAYWHF